ncbi:phosphatase PAP2 family protein [Aquipuribacter sp. MA13-6]|uniref:phosphatase PAP2 family protein n=1 Tax=unclassified Aquipuribacter TaxID=2635084 RepID=UPI003EE9EBDF
MRLDVRLPTRGETVAGARTVLDVLRQQWTLVLLLLVGVGVFAAMVAASAEVYENVQESDDLAVLDRPALDAAVDLRTPGLDRLVTAYTDLGGTVWAPIATTLLVVGLALLWRSWSPVVLMLAATAGSLAMTSVGKVVVARDRPDVELAVPPFETSAAFPSGHALNATVIAGVVAYLLILRARSVRVGVLVVVLAVTHAVLMGLSRVYLGHHWVTDVVVAWFLGAAWLALVVTVHQLLLRRLAHRSRRREEAPDVA